MADALRRKRVCLVNKQNAVQRRFTLVKRFHGSLTNVARDQVGAVHLDQLALPQHFKQSIDFPKRARYLRLAYARLQYKPFPTRPPGGHRADIEALNFRIENLQAELARLDVEKNGIETSAAGHRADFERERERCDNVIAEALRMTKVAISAPRNRSPPRGRARRSTEAGSSMVETCRRLGQPSAVHSELVNPAGL